jgi:sporulation protein YlmC with PRC-barrel domain
MKKKVLIGLGSILVSWVATTASGQFSQPMLAHEIIGSVIKDSYDQKLGTVKDLAVDLSNGRVTEVIVSWGGFLGVDSKYVAVLPDSFSVDAKVGIVRILNIDKQRLDAAPAVDLSKWSEAMEQPRVEQVYQYYDVTPYFLVQEHPAHGESAILHPLGRVERAGKLTGAEVMDQQNQKIGKVEDLVVDLPQGRVVEVAINSGHYLQTPDELSAVPPQALAYDSSRDVLTLDVTRDTLATMPRFSSRNWPAIDRDQATAVYQAYHTVPYFLPVGPNGENVQNGTTLSDARITAQIEKEIIDAPGLSGDVKTVQVSTLNGHVTLRGTVATSDEKRRIGEIAARIVPLADVDNQLQVRETAASSSS